MQFIYSEEHKLHAPDVLVARGTVIPTMEVPARADSLAQALRSAGRQLRPPRDFGRAPLAKVHTLDYLAFLETAWDRWQVLTAPPGGGPGAPLVHAHAFPVRHHMTGRPESIQGQVGYYISGGSAPLAAGTFKASLASANTALEAAELVLGGEREAYALCRPPGHHAYADLAGGFCYLNNVAIAAQHVVEKVGRVAIIDIDVHHGNGTQGIFYGRGDVHFVSVHCDPNVLYPFYAGFPHERGEGEGYGHTVNLPLQHRAGDGPFLSAIDQGLASIRGYAPAILLVSLGFDAYVGDPQAALSVTTDGFRAAGERIGALGLPTVLVQEGGYAVEKLGENLMAFLAGFAAHRGN